jgi:hypothetical protein
VVEFFIEIFAVNFLKTVFHEIKILNSKLLLGEIEHVLFFLDIECVCVRKIHFTIHLR